LTFSPPSFGDYPLIGLVIATNTCETTPPATRLNTETELPEIGVIVSLALLVNLQLRILLLLVLPLPPLLWPVKNDAIPIL
jgi:hypothetical protein